MPGLNLESRKKNKLQVLGRSFGGSKGPFLSSPERFLKEGLLNFKFNFAKTLQFLKITTVKKFTFSYL